MQWKTDSEVGFEVRQGLWPRLLAHVGLTTTNEMERQIALTAAEYEADDTGYNTGFEDGKQEAKGAHAAVFALVRDWLDEVGLADHDGGGLSVVDVEAALATYMQDPVFYEQRRATLRGKAMQSQWRAVAMLPISGGAYQVGGYVDNGTMPRHFVSGPGALYFFAGEAVWRGPDGIPIEYWQSLGPHPEHKDQPA